MPYEIGNIVNARNNTIRVKHPDVEYNPRTYLGAAVAAAGTALTVRDNSGFLSGLTNNERALIGSYGDDRAEIRRITADPAAGTSLTVAAVTFAHPIDTPVTIILWDQVEIHGNATNTVTGATLIVTLSITPDELFTQYIDTGATFAFYFARYRNSTIPRVSAFSDGVANTGYAAGSRALIKQRALARAGISLNFPLADGEVITDEFLNSEITTCELDIQQRSRKWSFIVTDNFTSVAGTAPTPIEILDSQREYTLPATILDDNSNRSIISMRVRWNTPLIYLYPQEFNERTRNVIKTEVATVILAADTSIVLDDTGDFTTSGDVVIRGDTISYTGNTRTTNTLTGVTGIVAGGHPVDAEVYQGASFGEPIYYTIKDGLLHLHPIPNVDLDRRNLNIEFYRTITPMDSDGDVTVVPFYNVFDIWLLWRIAERRKLFDEAGKWEQEYERRMAQALQDHVKAEEQKFYPGLAERQELTYTRGRFISTVIN